MPCSMKSTARFLFAATPNPKRLRRSSPSSPPMTPPSPLATSLPAMAAKLPGALPAAENTNSPPDSHPVGHLRALQYVLLDLYDLPHLVLAVLLGEETSCS